MSAPFEVTAFGDSAVLVSGQDSLLGFQEGLQIFGPVRPGMASLLIENVDAKTAVAEIQQWLKTAKPSALSSTRRQHLIPVTYDGEDLEEVAHYLGMGTDQVVLAHASLEWRVAMLGFSPGFGYLRTEQPNLFEPLPRLSQPRLRVPAGSVAVVAGMSAIYPSQSPGGWQLIGRTEVSLFDLNNKDPFLLNPGDRIIFERHD